MLFSLVWGPLENVDIFGRGAAVAGADVHEWTSHCSVFSCCLPPWLWCVRISHSSALSPQKNPAPLALRDSAETPELQLWCFRWPNVCWVIKNQPWARLLLRCCGRRPSLRCFCLGPPSSCRCGLADNHSIAAEREVSAAGAGRRRPLLSFSRSTQPSGLKQQLTSGGQGSGQAAGWSIQSTKGSEHTLRCTQKILQQLVTSVFHLYTFPCLHGPITLLTHRLKLPSYSAAGLNSVYCWFKLEETKKIKSSGLSKIPGSPQTLH